MRPPRIIVLVFFASAFLFILSRALTASALKTGPPRPPSEKQPGRSILGLFYYNTPFSLFPPNAAISLTDDNSTSFAARPAAFGPKLAPNGLSGQLWVGSGFTDDSLEGSGELGCSDIPGWDDDNTRTVFRHSLSDDPQTPPGLANNRGGSPLDTRQDHTKQPPSDPDRLAVVDDGTDNHLHQVLRRKDTFATSHADIQSIQESAEIKGKIVLLMRGGCGFLEKIMWAQRRGAIAVIVGDNQRGGPLIQMFAHGEEVDNVTIPSVFTARTSAQLLSALTQPGSFVGEDASNEVGGPLRRIGTKPGRTNKPPASSKRLSTAPRSGSGWFSRLFGRRTSPHIVGEDSRLDQSDKGLGSKNLKSVEQKSPKNESPNKPPPTGVTGPLGGIVTPGSGEYTPEAHVLKDGRTRTHPRESSSPEQRLGILSRLLLFGGESEQSSIRDPRHSAAEDDEAGAPRDDKPINPPHDGLWVTITPTSSASPFFDTLLVLVISPLVTLTIVYALLILRARIRRRRWRAPKSVVERLPVRTYHTVARSPSLSPRLPSPSSSSPTTPLLQQSPSRTRPRSQTTTGIPEREALFVPDASASGPSSRAAAGPSRRPGHEKRPGFSAEWRKYMGRQVECVVCLEEYIDGVSRVMRLPCGHEFHADCITPWLTTRRRTCPICKGDVVRSMARGSWAVPRYEPYHDDDEGDVEGEAEAEGSGYQSVTSSEASSSSELEQEAADAVPEPRRQNWQNGWLGIFFNGPGQRARRSPSPSGDR